MVPRVRSGGFDEDFGGLYGQLPMRDRPRRESLHRGRVQAEGRNPAQRRYIVGRLETEKDTEHGIELALHGEAFVQEIRRETRFCGRAVRGVRVTADKFTRALAWANRAEAGKVVLVRGAWNEEFLEEACRFPNARTTIRWTR